MDRKETAGPSTSLRFGRDDNFVLKVDEFARKTNKVTASRDDKWGVVTFMRGRQIGWTEKKQQVRLDFAQGRLSTALSCGPTASRITMLWEFDEKHPRQVSAYLPPALHFDWGERRSKILMSQM
jgi:hypothetical protein